MLIMLLLVAHIAVSLVLILVVLLQTGKRADLAGAFGGGGSQTAFGARGAATFLSKATTWSAIIFMATSIILGVMFGRETSTSVVEDSSSRPASSGPAPSSPQPVPVPPPASPTGTESPAQPSGPPAGQAPAPTQGSTGSEGQSPSGPGSK